MSTVYLTRRNLLTLLSKLDRAGRGEETARTIIKGDDAHPKFPSQRTMIVAVEDDVYYTDRSPGPTTEAEMLKSQIPWLQVIDEALVVSHQGVANFSDSHEVAQRKLHDLIMFEVEIATNPVVNGGFSLQKVPVDYPPDLIAGTHQIEVDPAPLLSATDRANRYNHKTRTESHESVINDAYKDHTS